MTQYQTLVVIGQQLQSMLPVMLIHEIMFTRRYSYNVILNVPI